MCRCVYMCVGVNTIDVGRCSQKYFGNWETLSFLLRNMKKAVVIRMPLEFIRHIASSTRWYIWSIEDNFYIVLTKILDRSSPLCSKCFFFLYSRRNEDFPTLENVVKKNARATTENRKIPFYCSKKKKKKHRAKNALQRNKNRYKLEKKIFFTTTITVNNNIVIIIVIVINISNNRHS